MFSFLAGLDPSQLIHFNLAQLWTAQFYAALMGIIALDLALSGDNAVVVATICNGLPKERQQLGLVLGILGAMVLRVIGAMVVGLVMGLPSVPMLIGAYLVYVAVGLVAAEGDGDAKAPRSTLLGAMVAVAAADIGMSMDNVAAVAALAKGDDLLMTVGIVLSIALMAVGTAVIMRLIERFPVIKWGGAALLGWVAGGVFIQDVCLKHAVEVSGYAHLVVPAIGVGLVLIIGVMANAWAEMKAEPAAA